MLAFDIIIQRLWNFHRTPLTRPQDYELHENLKQLPLTAAFGRLTTQNGDVPFCQGIAYQSFKLIASATPSIMNLMNTGMRHLTFDTR